MGDMNVETAATCATNVAWETKVIGSKGTHVVSWGRTPNGEAQYGWRCTCKAFEFHPEKPCKHIAMVEADGQRCAWNEALDAGIQPAENNRCPNCGGPVEFFRVAV